MRPRLYRYRLCRKGLPSAQFFGAPHALLRPYINNSRFVVSFNALSKTPRIVEQYPDTRIEPIFWIKGSLLFAWLTLTSTNLHPPASCLVQKIHILDHLRSSARSSCILGPEDTFKYD